MSKNNLRCVRFDLNVGFHIANEELQIPELNMVMVISPILCNYRLDNNSYKYIALFLVQLVDIFYLCIFSYL